MRILPAVLIILLSACAGPHKLGPQPPDPLVWQQHQDRTGDIEQWNISGRVAVSSRNHGGHADLFWQQRDPRDYDIKLVAPFGGGSSLIQARARGVMLSTSDGQQLYGSDIDSLLSGVEELQFPVSGLRYWIRGLPSPTSDVRLMGWNLQGLPSLLQQDGWRVQLRNYKPVGEYRLPHKVFMTRPDDPDIDVRLVIRQWGLQ